MTRTRDGSALRVPAAVRRAADELATRRGVVGVFWGNPRRGGLATAERAVVVHVRRKKPPARAGTDCIPTRIAGVRTDVIEVRHASQHWLDASDPVQCDDRDRGRSTITALAKRGGAVYALVSGHGTLPVANGHLVSQYDSSRPARVAIIDPGGARYLGKLEGGHLNATCDFAMVRMDCGPADANAFHYAAGDYPPFTIRRSTLREAEEVSHYSALRRRLMIGRVLHIAVGHTYVPGFGGQDFPYLDIAIVESPDPAQPFSKHGDSGSLVVDRQRRVIGTVIGGDSRANIAYVLPMTGAVTALGSTSRMFLQPEDE